MVMFASTTYHILFIYSIFHIATFFYNNIIFTMAYEGINHSFPRYTHTHIWSYYSVIFNTQKFIVSVMNAW